MANEIANYTDIYRKTSLGHDNNQCPNKTSVLGISNEIKINGTYTDNQCVLIDDIERYAEDWVYTFEVTPTELWFQSSGGTQTVTVTSYKDRYVNGVSTGERETVGYTRNDAQEISGTGETITMGSSSSTEETTVYATFTQNESGDWHKVLCRREPLTTNEPWYLNVNNQTSLPITLENHYKGIIVESIGVQSYSYSDILIPKVDTIIVIKLPTDVIQSSSKIIISGSEVDLIGKQIDNFYNYANYTGTNMTISVSPSGSSNEYMEVFLQDSDVHNEIIFKSSFNLPNKIIGNLEIVRL